MSREIQEVTNGLVLEKQIKQSLITQANATTGKTDTDLTSAVGSLVKGFGGGSCGELITMTTSCVNAYEVFEVLKPLVETGQGCLFVCKGFPEKTFPERQCITFVVYKNSKNEYSGAWTRLAGGNLNTYAGNTTTFDLIINVGDEYEKVVLW